MSTRAQRREAARLMPPEWHSWQTKRRIAYFGRTFCVLVGGVALARLYVTHGWQAAALAVWVLIAAAGFVAMGAPEFTIYVDNRPREDARDSAPTTEGDET